MFRHMPPSIPWPRGTRVPSFVMDRPVLHSLVAELVASERLGELADALPTRARVSEPALPILLAALHERLEHALVVVLPEDADARDAAEAAAWFLGEDGVGLLPSRGVAWSSGLAAPPHLVGERARALHVLERGGLVCVSARALAEGLPPVEARPEPVEVGTGLEPGVEGLSEELALAGYERVERVDDRGQFAVRGGIVDVFPTTGREPLRVEFFGDEIESVRAFSPFTQRALHPVAEATLYPAAERRLDTLELSDNLSLRKEEGEEPGPPPAPDDLVPVLAGPPDLVFEPDAVRRVWEDDGVAAPPPLAGATELDPFPQAQPLAFEAQRPAIAARGLAEAASERAALGRPRPRAVVARSLSGRGSPRAAIAGRCASKASGCACGNGSSSVAPASGGGAATPSSSQTRRTASGSKTRSGGPASTGTRSSGAGGGPGSSPSSFLSDKLSLSSSVSSRRSAAG